MDRKFPNIYLVCYLVMDFICYIKVDQNGKQSGLRAKKVMEQEDKREFNQKERGQYKLSVASMCGMLEQKMAIFDADGNDYLNWLASKALESQSEADRSFFSSENFYCLANIIKNFRSLKQMAQVKLEDYLRLQTQEQINSVARALLDIKPIINRYAHQEPSQQKQRMQNLFVPLASQNGAQDVRAKGQQSRQEVNADVELARAILIADAAAQDESAKKKKLDADEAMARQLQAEFDSRGRNREAIADRDPNEEEKYDRRHLNLHDLDQDEQPDYYSEDAMVLEALGMKLAAFKPEWFDAGARLASLEQQIELYKPQMIKSTFDRYGLEDPAADKNAYNDPYAMGLGLPQKRRKFGAVGINALYGQIPVLQNRGFGAQAQPQPYAANAIDVEQLDENKIVLSDQEQEQIEGLYQNHLLKMEEKVNDYVMIGQQEDIYSAKFAHHELNSCTLTPTLGDQNISIKLYRRLKGLPTFFYDQSDFNIRLDAGAAGVRLDDRVREQISRGVKKAEQTRNDQSEPLSGHQNKILFVKAGEKKHAYVIDLKEVTKPLTLTLHIIESHQLKTFNLYRAILPQLEGGVKHRQSELDQESFEYRTVAKLFQDTFRKSEGPLNAGLQPLMNHVVRNGQGRQGAGGIRQPKIHSILKLENKTVQLNFVNELKKNFEKFPNKMPSQLIKLLFHGSGKSDTDVKEIYESEEGLDIRFSNYGAFGQGLYFADNSAYSHQYAAQTEIEGQSYRQMFVCFVLPGESCQNPRNPNQLRLPPFKDQQNNERYDSVTNGDGSHTVTYSNAKAYPAYLVQYQA